jgi:hypothetical protein
MSILLTDDQLDERLKRLFVHHQGRERAIPRWQLVTEIFGPGAELPQTDDNLHDRAIRSAVERLRSAGSMILDMGDGHGRWLALSADEYRMFRTSYLKPLRSRADVIRAMDKWALAKWPNSLQPSLFEADVMEELSVLP